jgi:alkyl hydroperoxide reductase subunit F
MYDLIIIGAGPAGITASIYAARQKIDTLVISNDIGGQTAISGAIENYTGYQFISGPELTRKFEEHLKQFDLKLKEQQEVVHVGKRGGVITVQTAKHSYQARALIIASGKRPRLLNVPGEKELKNRGVSYCAICDGPLFAGKAVAVIGGGNSALDATIQMMKIANKVYLININSALGGEITLRQKVGAAQNVEVINNGRTQEILGDKFVRGIRIEANAQERTIEVEGVFIEIGLVPGCDFIRIVQKNQKGEIKVNTRCQTNIEGIFAAGDVTDVPQKQIIVAAGEGAKAALGVARYLSERR